MTQSRLTKEKFIDLCADKVLDQFIDDFSEDYLMGGCTLQIMCLIAEFNNQLKDQGRPYYKWTNNGRISNNFQRLRDEIYYMSNSVVRKCGVINKQMEDCYA